MKRFGLFCITLAAFLFLTLVTTTLHAQTVPYCATSAFGNGKNATGGGNATPVLVNSVDGLKNALNKGKNKVIIITQNLTFTSMLSVQDGANVTLMALPGVKLTSLEQTSSTSGILFVKRFSNLIIRNITFVGPGAYDCDGNDLLCFENTTNAWVDHCDFQDGCDGNFDNKASTDNVTVSWCRFRYLKEPRAGGSGGADDHRFTNLLGSSSSDKPSDGTYNFTWAYCWWDEGCKERMVRCRNCELHFLNCYWNSSVANYYVGPENAKCYFEGCTFEGKANTSAKIFKSYGGTNACKFVNCVGNLPSNSGSVSAPTYSYTALAASTAKSAVTNSSCGAGATLQVTTSGAIYSSCDGSTPTVYTVTWNATANGGSCSTATTQVVAGSSIGQLPTATKSGYTFNGWFTSATGGTQISASTVPSGNVTYYAQFTENQGGDPTPSGEITWNFSDAEFNSLGTISETTTINGLTITVTSDKTVTIDASDKTVGDITFTHRLKTGGTGAANARSLYFDVTGPCTIDVYCCSSGSADRTVNMYSGSYGGTLLTTMSAPQSNPIKNTYNYTGGATTIYVGSANSGVNFYGINRVYSGGGDPTPTSYTLTYDENGGSGTMAEQTGTTVTVASNAFTPPTGYTFKEWNTNSRGAGTTYTAGQNITLTSDLTLYAVWQPNTYSVTLNAMGGTGGTANIIVTYDAAMPNITIPTREGYSFLGYFSGQNGAGTQYYDANGSSTNSWITADGGTLYAHWEEISVTPITDGDLHFWFFYATDATTNGVSNDATVFSSMVASSSQMAGSITIDGKSYSVTRRTGDTQVFGSFTIPSGKEAIFYALAVSSGNGDRQINLVRGGTTYELPVAGGSDSYKRLESETLPAGTYSIERDGSSNVRLAVVVLRIVDAGSTPVPTNYTVTWNANGGTCATATSSIEENAPVGSLPEATREGYTFDGWFTSATGGDAVTASTIITGDITFFAHWTENQGGGGETTGSVIFHWRWAGEGTAPIAGDALITISGTMTAQRSDDSKTFSTESAAYAASVPNDLKSLGSKGVKLGANALYFVIEPIATAEGFKRGDTIYVCGYNPIKVSSSDGHAGDISDSIQTGTSKSDYQFGYVVLNKNASALYLMRARGSGTGLSGIKVVRPQNVPAATYTVTWENYDGTILETDTDVEEGTTPEYNGAEPFHYGDEQYSYTFAGWSPAISPVTANITYTAQFDSTVNTYLVEFYNWNSILLQSSKWEYGATPVYSGPAITREDDHQYTYTFAGWDPQIEPVTGEAFYFATFSSQLRTFSANDVVTSNDPDMGSVAISPQQNEYEYGEQITVTATPQQGYVFSGWQNEDDEIISTDATTTISVTDSTITAIFVPSTHTKYIVSHWIETLDGNFNREHSDTLYGTTGGWTQAKAKTLTGFYAQSFDQKRIGADGMTEVEIYYYRYQYEIKFIVEGEVLQVSNWRYGATPTYNGTPTKQSDAQYTYTFTGWDPQITTVTGEATYRAVFERAINSYTVTFHANGHGEDPNSQTIEYGKMITCTPMYVEGWEFGGWFREAACQNQWNCQQDVVTANIDLYAKWTPSENMFYEVIYWQQNINDDGYTAVETESKRGTTGQMTEAIAKDYVGFVMLPFNQEPIDVNTTINIYYNRLLFEVQFIVEGVAVQTDSIRYYGSAEYRGETPTKPETDTHYYTFSDWDKAINMPIVEDVTFTALFSEWTKEDPTDLNEANEAPTARKVMIDNHVYIIIGDQIYDILGNKR